MEFENLLKLIQAVSDSELTGLKYEEKGVKLHLTKEKETIVTAVQTADSPAAFARRGRRGSSGRPGSGPCSGFGGSSRVCAGTGGIGGDGHRALWQDRQEPPGGNLLCGSC